MIELGLNRGLGVGLRVRVDIQRTLLHSVQIKLPIIVSGHIPSLYDYRAGNSKRHIEIMDFSEHSLKFLAFQLLRSNALRPVARRRYTLQADSGNAKEGVPRWLLYRRLNASYASEISCRSETALNSIKQRNAQTNELEQTESFALELAKFDAGVIRSSYPILVINYPADIFDAPPEEKSLVLGVWESSHLLYQQNVANSCVDYHGEKRSLHGFWFPRPLDSGSCTIVHPAFISSNSTFILEASELCRA
ncbi:hypothetical protein BJ165DRAFT_1400448 [Panaeolus papilionaceus]|nr:hypothetical protein BJ165DRAFT_1400448 [Panaeolus papilionaceus]